VGHATPRSSVCDSPERQRRAGRVARRALEAAAEVVEREVAARELRRLEAHLDRASRAAPRVDLDDARDAAEQRRDAQLDELEQLRLGARRAT
jgi:hypothetical protein